MSAPRAQPSATAGLCGVRQEALAGVEQWQAANNFPAFPDDTPEHTNQTGMIAVVEEQPERTQQLFSVSP